MVIGMETIATIKEDGAIGHMGRYSISWVIFGSSLRNVMTNATS